ncbi:MAG: hypothetical protein QOE63_1520 [Acidimicrobiaceae bacterium]
MRLDANLLALAAEQCSCVALWQARDLGATDTEITRMKRSHLWTPVTGAVVSVAGVAVDDSVLTSASVLAAGPGAFLSHGPGAAWFGHAGFALTPAIVSQLHGHTHRTRTRAAIRDLVIAPAHWITTYNGVSVARPELLAYQLCGDCSFERAERVLDWFWSQGLLTIASAKLCLSELAERGRDGTVAYRKILRARNDDQQPFASGLESRVGQIASDMGVSLRRQVDSGGEQWEARVDFRDEGRPFVLEVYSRRYHAALSYQRHDEERHKRLEHAGFVVRVVWDDDVWTRPGHVVDVIWEGRRSAPQAKSRR